MSDYTSSRRRLATFLAIALVAILGLVLLTSSDRQASAQSEPADNLLVNSGFEPPLYREPWKLIREGASAVWAPTSQARTGKRSLQVWVNSSPAPGRVQIRQNNVRLPAGQLCLSWDAASDLAAPITARVLNSTGGVVSEFTSAPMRTRWSSSEHQFEIQATAQNATVSLLVGQGQRSVQIDNVELVPRGCSSPQPTATATPRTAPTAVPTPQPAATPIPTAVIPTGSNLLTNPGFEPPRYLNGWNLVRQGASAVWAPNSDASSGNRSMKVWVNSSQSPAQVRVTQSNLAIVAGPMCASVDLRTYTANTSPISMQFRDGAFVVGTTSSARLTSNWSRQEVQLQIRATVPNATFELLVGQGQRSIGIDNLELTNGSCANPAPVATPTPRSTAVPTATATPTAPVQSASTPTPASPVSGSGVNLVTNPGFEPPAYLNGWTLVRQGASAVWAPNSNAASGTRSLKVWVNSSPGASFVRVTQPVEATSGPMCLSVDVRGDVAGPPILIRLHDGSVNLTATSVAVRDSWTTSQVPLQVNATTAPVVTLEILIGQTQRTISLDNVTLTSESCGTPAAATPTPQPTATPRSTAIPTPTPIPPQARVAAGLGISTSAFIDAISAAELTADMDLIESLGVTQARVDINWRQVERIEGTYDWSVPDAIIGAARAEGLTVLATLAYAPDWAINENAPIDTSPINVERFAAFSRAAAQRYRSQGVTTFEIWNEPNLDTFWIGAPSVPAYSELLISAAREIRLVNPDATVLTGGVAAAPTLAGRSVSPIDFLQGLYDEGARSSFDGFAIHPYSYPALPTFNAPWNPFHRMQDMRDIMVSNGDSAKMIWVTEYGAPTGTHPRAVTEAAQRDMVLQAAECQAAVSWLGPMFLYQHRDRPGGSTPTLEDNFGLSYANRSPKLVWAPLQDLLQTAAADASCPFT